ncbi:MAG: GTP 3',8-cyclase MoaA [Collinsella sp.]
MDGHVQHDGFGRDINYLRIAVTDKCNFRCIYCMPADGVAPRAHDELLSAEEIARFVRLVAGEGIRRVRLTGGEPLVSRRIIPLIRDIRAIPQIEDISLTTNGALLPSWRRSSKMPGLAASTSRRHARPSLFGKITRLGRLEQTMAGIDAALAWGFEPVKVNCVVVRRLNQDVAALARLTVDRPIHLRFIEYMPIGDEHTSSHCAVDPHAPALNPELWDASDTVPSDELRARINAGAAAAGLGELEPLDINDAPAGAGPARYWHFPGAAGTVGFISAMSNHFCAYCNRLRLTADGNVRPCLFSDAEYSVRDALRRGDDMQVLSIWRDAVAHKPQEHAIIEGTQRFMSQIGG